MVLWCSEGFETRDDEIGFETIDCRSIVSLLNSWCLCNSRGIEPVQFPTNRNSFILGL